MKTDDNLPDTSTSMSNAITNYNSLVNLPAGLKSTLGEDVSIAVLDSGCHKTHKDLKTKILHSYDALTGTSEIRDKSINGHGTFICGIIAGNTQGNGITGMAPGANLIPVRVIEDSAVTASNIIKGLKWLLNDCPTLPDIINMSFDFFPGADIIEFEQLLQQAIDRNIIIVTAGQDYLMDPEPGIYYPAITGKTLAVATLHEKIVQGPGFTGINETINFIIPNFKYTSTGNSNFLKYREAEGSSFATAVITGAIALALSFKKKHPDEKNVLDLLFDNIPPFDKSTFYHNFKIWKR